MSTCEIPVKAPSESSTAAISPLLGDLAQYLRDESKLSAESARGVFLPKSLAELQSVLSALAKSGSKITVSAARTGLTGGSVPDADSFVLSLERLKGIELTPSPDTVKVLAGTTWSELTEFLGEHLPEYFFPVDPTEQSASIGGAVVLNAGGARSLRFGSVRNWVTALKVFLADGSEIQCNRGEIVAKNGSFAITDSYGTRRLEVTPIKKPSTKNTIGYFLSEESDLLDLFVGSEGSLGIIGEITLKLEKKPGVLLSHLQVFRSDISALKAVEFLRTNFSPFSLELIDSRSIAKVAERPKAAAERFLKLHEGLPSSEDSAALFLELPLKDEEELILFSESFFTFLVDLDEDPERAISGTDDRTLADIKKLRHLVPERMNEIIAERRATYPGLHKIAMDMAVEDRDLFWVYNLYQQELNLRGFEYAIFGHAGNNHFHVNILPRNLEELSEAKAAYFVLAQQIVKRGGAVAAEHGIGRLKREFLKAQYSAEELEQFKSIRKFFDPDGRLNSHVLV